MQGVPGGNTAEPRARGPIPTIPPHYLRAAKREWSPRNVACIDTETRWSPHPLGRSHSLRCWAVTRALRPVNRAPVSCVEQWSGTLTDDALTALEVCTTGQRVTWVYAHNLAFDATVLALPGSLTERGWRLQRMAVTDGPAWFRFTRGNKSIVITDSAAIWPHSLGTIAADLQAAKTPLPDNDDDDMDTWLAHCERDADILMQAILRALQWWDDNRMGKWGITGSSSGWNAFRHKYLDHKILINIDKDALDFERRAVYGGRREAFKTGHYPDGYFADIDFAGAYPSIASNCNLPSRRGVPFTMAPDGWHRRKPDNVGIIAECIVRTKTPSVPAKYGGTIFYPRGEFKTVLASPEIDLIERTGGTVTIGRGYRYVLAPVMRTWGNAILDILRTHPDNLNPVVQRMVKHWSRAVIGRWTMQLTRSREPLQVSFSSQPVTENTIIEYDPADTYMLDGISRYKRGANPSKVTKSWIVNTPDMFLEFIRDQEPENSFPAIWVFIESWCRVLLWEAISQAPGGALLQCDTDGFLLGWSRRNARRLWQDKRDPDNAPPGPWSAEWQPPVPESVRDVQLALKGLYRDATIIGPQQLKLGTERRMAGVPSDAKEGGDGKWHGSVWPGLMGQMRIGKPGLFVQQNRTMAIKGTSNPRWQSSGHSTMPVTMYLKDGVNQISGPPRTDMNGNEFRLGELQHPLLAALL